MGHLINKVKSNLLFWIATIAAFPAFAIEPETIEIGAFDVIPTIAINASHNDNLFRDLDTKTRSSFMVVAPSVVAVLQGSSSLITLQADIIDEKFAESSDDDTTDWNVAAAVEIDITSRNRLSANASVFSTHEQRGTGFSEAGELPEEPTPFEIRAYNLGYQFGSDQSRGQLDLNLSRENIEYSTNAIESFARDRSTLGANTTFTLRASPDYNWLFSYRYSEINYALDSLEALGSPDSQESYALLGLTWQSELSISGTVLFGYAEKKYSSALRENQDIPSWEVDILWEPYNYSRFNFSANSSFSESPLFGNSRSGEIYTLGWDYNWTDRLNSSFSVQRRQESFGGFDREDIADTPSIIVSYAFRRWLDFSLSLRRELLDSSDLSFNYSQRVISFGIQASL